jgi:hypothetical protein
MARNAIYRLKRLRLVCLSGNEALTRKVLREEKDKLNPLCIYSVSGNRNSSSTSICRSYSKTLELNTSKDEALLQSRQFEEGGKGLDLQIDTILLTRQS